MSLSGYDVFWVKESTERVINAIENAPLGLCRVKRVKASMDDVLFRVRTLCDGATALLDEKDDILLSLASLRSECDSLRRGNEELKKQLEKKEAQYADAVSRWAGLARLWQEEHGGGLVYVKETADGGVQVWDEAVGDGCEPSAVIELKPIGKTVAGRVYVTSEERKAEENENVALEAAAVSAGCAAEGTETGADCDPPELAGQGNAGASAGEQGDGIPKG